MKNLETLQKAVNHTEFVKRFKESVAHYTMTTMQNDDFDELANDMTEMLNTLGLADARYTAWLLSQKENKETGSGSFYAAFIDIDAIDFILHEFSEDFIAEFKDSVENIFSY